MEFNQELIEQLLVFIESKTSEKNSQITSVINTWDSFANEMKNIIIEFAVDKNVSFESPSGYLLWLLEKKNAINASVV
ncbi:MAG: hypothetical protein KDH96_03070 [Candidatus Riesia sp.]|nr:hypothetical protein [Candidatus Riesia sp.]